MFIDLSKENNRKKAVNEEKVFLEMLGLQFSPYMEGGNVGSINKDGKVIGFILSADCGYLKTRIDGNGISANYTIEDEMDGIVYRSLTLIIDSREVELTNIHTEEFEYLECMDGNESYSLTIAEDGISSMYLSGKIQKDESTDSVIERFRGICPELIDYLINKYGNKPKQKTKQ